MAQNYSGFTDPVAPDQGGGYPQQRSPYLAQFLGQGQPQHPIGSPQQLGVNLLAQALMQQAPKPGQGAGLGGLFSLGQNNLSNGWNQTAKMYDMSGGMK